MKNTILHGDVDLIQIDSLPENLQKVEHTKKYVVRHGESGHKHMIVADRLDDLEVYINPETTLHFLDVKKTVTITHEEHRTLVIEPGFYEEKKETEYNPFEKQLQEVLD